MRRALTILAASLLPMLFALEPAMAEDPFDLIVHGNWCGPGARDGQAIDSLDAACQAHDLCVRREGWLDCGCDLAFMDTLRRQSWPSEALYQKARAVYETIALVPCRGVKGQMTKLDWVHNDWRGAVASGREAPEARAQRFFRLLAVGLSTGDTH